MTDDQTIWAVILIGTVVPVAYVLFVIVLTRRGKAFSRMDSFFSSIEGLHEALHAAFVSDMAKKRVDRVQARPSP